MAMGTKGLKAAENALRLRALGEFPWLKVPIHNLAYNLSHNPVYNPAYNLACNPAEGGCGRVAVII